MTGVRPALSICRDIAAAMARYRGADALREVMRRLHAGLGCDASLLLERLDEGAAVCRFCEGGDGMLRSLTHPGIMAEALADFECRVYPDYPLTTPGDPILRAWGARTIAVLPLGADRDTGGAMLLLWRSPNRLLADFSPAIEPVWALLQVLYPGERSLRELDEWVHRLSAILETVPEAVAFVESDGVRGWVNGQAAELLRLAPGAVRPSQLAAAMQHLRANAANSEQILATSALLARDPQAEIRDWIWELRKPWRILCVTSRVTSVNGVHGRIWVLADTTAHRVIDDALTTSRRFAERILSTSPDLIYIHDLSERKSVYVNEQLEPVLGYSPNFFLQKYDLISLLCHPDDLSKLRDHYAACALAQEGQVLQIECRLRHAGGDWRWLLIRDSPFQTDESGRVTQILGFAADITDRVDTEAELRDQQQRWQLALDGANDGIWDWNAVTGEVFCSARWKEMLGFAPEELPNDTDVWVSLVHPDDLPRVKELLEMHLHRLTPTYFAEYRIRHRDGHYLWVLARGKAIWDEKGNPLRMAGAHADVTERKHAEAQLSYQAQHDALTGLANRRHFLSLLQQSLAEAIREKRSVTLSICDIDFFKQVNDLYGHNAGDHVLSTFAEVLREETRRSDIAGRMGGDEFYMLLTHAAVNDAANILNRIRERWAAIAFPSPDGGEFHVTSTFGMAELRPHMDSKALIEAADKALYLAKHRGRNRVEAFPG